jgi:hypothetical protein
MRRAARREGFALPLTLFLISILTLMLTAAFAKVQSDRRVAESSGANVNALAVAKAGLQQYMGTRPFNTPGSPTSPWRPPDGDSSRITLTGGYADVIAKVMRRPADTLANWLYVIRSVGHVIDPVQGADPQAVRTIAQFAQWQTGRMDILAAFTAANKLDHPDGTGEFNGADQCGVAPDVYAIRVPGGAGVINPPQSDYATSGLGSSPNVLGTGTKKETADGTNVDWKAVSQGAFTADFSSPINVRVADYNYPSQIITSDSARLHDPSGGGVTVGTGLLIVTGDLYVTGEEVQWYGIVLVGGEIYFKAGTQLFDGIVITGLKEQLSVATSVGALGTGYVDVDYNSCLVKTTLQNLTGFAPVSNGWVDNWAVY